MKHFLPILLVSFMFAGELEVEGGITATGEIQSPTIEALLLQIAQLQSQLNALQASNSLETRIFEISDITITEWEPYEFNLNTITGYDLENAFVSIVDFDVTSYDYTVNYINVIRHSPSYGVLFNLNFSETEDEYIGGGRTFVVNDGMDCFFHYKGSNPVTFNMTFYIT